MTCYVKDFQILRQRSLLIGDASRGMDGERHHVAFDMTDIEISEPCILHYEVRGLRLATQTPRVEINGTRMGDIERVAQVAYGACAGGQACDGLCSWMHRSMVIPGGRIRTGVNTLQVAPPDEAPVEKRAFQVRNVVIFYRACAAQGTMP